MYLYSKNAEDDSIATARSWDHLQQFIPLTEEGKQQRRIDLSHALSVAVRTADWETSYRYLRDPNCDVSHVAQVLRGVALADTVDLKRLSVLYRDYRPIIFHDNNPSVMKDYLFVVDLMLDVCSLCEDSTLLHQVISDIVENANSPTPMVLTNKLFARIARLSIEERFTDCVYELYTLRGGEFRAMLRVFRMMERYMRNLKATDDRMREMKLHIASLHYSNPEGEGTESSSVTENANTEEEKGRDGKYENQNYHTEVGDESEDNDDDLYLEPSVLSILKDFDPTGNRSQKAHSGKVQRKTKNAERGVQQERWKREEENRGGRRREQRGKEKEEERSGKGRGGVMEKFTFSEERKQTAGGRDSKREGGSYFQRHEQGRKGKTFKPIPKKENNRMKREERE